MLQGLETLLAEANNRQLTVNNFKLSNSSQKEFKASTVYLRMGIWEACEIFRLCEGMGTESREMMQRFRDKMMEWTKSEHNLLPHELSGKMQTLLTAKEKSPLLPRHDNI